MAGSILRSVEERKVPLEQVPEPDRATGGAESTRPSGPSQPPTIDESRRETDAPREPTLGELVSSLTRRAPDVALATLVVVGIVGAGLVWLLAPDLWRAVPVFVLLSAVGVSGIADRECGSQGTRRVVVVGVRGVAVLASPLAAGTLVLMFMRLVLGRSIS